MEIRFEGTVTTPPTFFYGRRSHAEHEQFDCRADDGRTIRVIDNVTLAPRVPVRPGDRVTVQGEEVHDPRPAADRALDPPRPAAPPPRRLHRLRAGASYA